VPDGTGREKVPIKDRAPRENERCSNEYCGRKWASLNKGKRGTETEGERGMKRPALENEYGERRGKRGLAESWGEIRATHREALDEDGWRFETRTASTA